MIRFTITTCLLLASSPAFSQTVTEQLPPRDVNTVKETDSKALPIKALTYTDGIAHLHAFYKIFTNQDLQRLPIKNIASVTDMMGAFGPALWSRPRK